MTFERLRTPLTPGRFVVPYGGRVSERESFEWRDAQDFALIGLKIT